MGSTPIYAFPFPAGTDTPDGPADFLSLASAIEAKFVTVDAAITAANVLITANQAATTAVDTRLTGLRTAIVSSDDFARDIVSTTYATIGTTAAVTLSYPPSGIITISMLAGIGFSVAPSGSGNNEIFLSPVVYNGSVGGTVLTAASDDLALAIRDYTNKTTQHSVGGSVSVYVSAPASGNLCVSFQGKVNNAGLHGQAQRINLSVIPSP